MDNKGYYKLLGIDTKSSEKDIKTAYKNLAKRYHSDGQVVGNALKECKTEKERVELKKKMDKKFSDITAAYEVLSNPQKRQMYDSGINTEHGFGEGSGESFFSSFFGGSMFGGERRPQKNNPRVENVHITLLQVITGVQMKKRIARKLMCKPCKATGSLNTKACVKCRGSGVYAEIVNMGGIRLQQEVTCEVCGGHGIIKSGPSCGDCVGKGYIVKQEEIEINIPAGIADGTKLAYEGMGDEAAGVVTGDFIFVVNVKENVKFTRITSDHLYTETRVPIEDILLQRPVKVETIEGKMICVGYPPIQNCDIGEDFLRLEKEGVPGKRGERGCLFIRLVPILVAPSKLKDLGRLLLDEKARSEEVKETHKAVFISKNDISKWYKENQQRSSRGHRSTEQTSSQTCQTA